MTSYSVNRHTGERDTMRGMKEERMERKRLRVSWRGRRRRRLSPIQKRKHHILWCCLRRTRNNTLLRFLNIFKKLEITIPFGEALQQMPLYSKFLNDLLTKKGKYIHSDDIVVEGNCSAIIQRILLAKYKDPRSVTIPCSIGAVSVGKTLINLGARINLMPLSMCRRIGELEILQTRMTLQIAEKYIYTEKFVSSIHA